ncbi:MAG: DUF418 domain-containing protein [Luteolibacter sp.]
MIFFSQPQELFDPRAASWLGSWDMVADWFSAFLVEGKFYPIFSLLFGVGFFLQMERLELGTGDYKQIFNRRLFILCLLGLAHGILLWDGDVLLYYGLSGFLLMLFKNRKSITLMIWAGCLIMIPVALMLVCWGFFYWAMQTPELYEEISMSMAPDGEEQTALFRAYIDGGYFDAVSYRLANLFYTFLMVMAFWPPFFAMFLVGMVAGRNRIFQDVEKNRRILMRLLVITGAVGLFINFAGAWVLSIGSAKMDYSLTILGTAINGVGGPILAVFYVTAFLLILNRRPVHAAWTMLGAAGRMPLTNYICQSLIATTIFYGYGFGLAGEVGRLGTIVLALLIFVMQIFASKLWLARFRFGPLEWLWRSLTYGKMQRM